MSCLQLSPGLGIKPAPLAVETPNLNHWTAREFPHLSLFIWLHPMAWGILLPQPGTKLESPAVEAQSLTHWTTREVPLSFFKKLEL